MCERTTDENEKDTFRFRSEVDQREREAGVRIREDVDFKGNS